MHKTIYERLQLKLSLSILTNHEQARPQPELITF